MKRRSLFSTSLSVWISFSPVNDSRQEWERRKELPPDSSPEPSLRLPLFERPPPTETPPQTNTQDVLSVSLLLAVIAFRKETLCLGLRFITQLEHCLKYKRRSMNIVAWMNKPLNAWVFSKWCIQLCSCGIRTESNFIPNSTPTAEKEITIKIHHRSKQQEQQKYLRWGGGGGGIGWSGQKGQTSS